jgi:hypothetical protein
LVAGVDELHLALGSPRPKHFSAPAQPERPVDETAGVSNGLSVERLLSSFIASP